MVDVGILEKEIDQNEKQLKQVKKDLKTAQKNEKKQYQAMKKRIKFMYERGDSAVISSLLESKVWRICSTVWSILMRSMIMTGIC